MSPQYIYELSITPSGDSGGWGALWTQLFFLFLGIVLSSLVTAVLVYGTFQELRGRHASLGDCIARGLAVMVPVIGVSILVGLSIVVGLILLIGPGLVAMTLLWVAIPAAVMERPGVQASLKRSKDLTEDHVWAVFGLIVILFGAGLVVNFAIAAVLGGGGPFGGDSGSTATILAKLVSDGFFSALGAVVSAVCYHELRRAKEGVGTEQIAAIFD